MHTSITTAALAVAITAAGASAAAITPGDLVVAKVNVVTTPTDGAGAVSLLEYTPSGTLVQTISVPSTGASALTVRGSSSTEAVLSLSPDGRYITFGGYRNDAGGANPETTTNARVIGVLDTTTGSVDTSRSISGAVSGGSFVNDSFRSVVTNDGTKFYLSGAGDGTGSAATGGVRYFDGTTVSVINNGTTAKKANARQVQVIGGRLFATSGAANPGLSVFQVGSGLPTSGDQTYTATIPSANANDQFQNFFFADLTAASFNGTGLDTVYVSNNGTNVGAVSKFVFNGTAWTGAGTITGTFTGLTGVVLGTGVTLYATDPTAGTGTIGTLNDASAATSTLSGTFTTIGDASGSNSAYRGIVIATPEPASLALLGLTGLAALRRRRA